MKSYNLLFELIFYFFHLGLFAEESLSIKCTEDYVFEFKGVITSPNYPAPLNKSYCHMWKIPVPPGTHLQIHLFDLDISEDLTCKKGEQCCGRNRLTLSPNTNNSMHFCGRKGQFPHSISISQSPAKIRYIYTNPVPSDRGFSLNYMTVILRDFKKNCDDDRFECNNGTCIPGEMKCDFNIDCLDGEDEQICPTYGKCPKGEIACRSSPKYCYKPEHRCDGVSNVFSGTMKSDVCLTAASA
ncbi:low-density lipoprotein receptor-related protein 12 isoform X2 [Nilaparvata lugens]|uniref:low-density lipoprotein receptor-related protein 12 isoform X2 n=1 Tax=Nilaparvata lugens TaxID=108931 RepID=UPI00193DC39D|nr:low-density lipoprotein receptor-related protein 12 isoform X2 [Nilaparvata lugens]XP_039278109.1 low-density lipoprotein receptor-related protein 12 isoform X2 [Nilaparvata lugens]